MSAIFYPMGAVQLWGGCYLIPCELGVRWSWDDFRIPEWFFFKGKNKAICMAPLFWALIFRGKEGQGWEDSSLPRSFRGERILCWGPATALRLGSTLWSHGFLSPLFSSTHSMAMRETAKYSNKNYHGKFWLFPRIAQWSRKQVLEQINLGSYLSANV